MQDEGPKTALGTGQGISRDHQVPTAARMAELERWVAKPVVQGSGVLDLDQLMASMSRENPNRNTLSELNALAMASWRAFRIHLDECVHYAECRICEYVHLKT
jgi:hypothetical protein